MCVVLPETSDMGKKLEFVHYFTWFSREMCLNDSHEYDKIMKYKHKKQGIFY